MAPEISARPAQLAEVLQLLTQAGSARADTTMGTASVADLCEGAQAFAIEADGQARAAYAVRLVDHNGIRVAWVMAAGGGLPGVDLIATGYPALEHQARQLGARQIAFTTRRRGLIHKAQALGFVPAGITMRKNIE